MKRLLIRDDDVNRFTTIEQLTGVYDFLFEKRIPVNFSAIPLVDTSATTVSDHFGCGSYEPFIPKQVQGGGVHYISENIELCRFLFKNPRFEILMHGLNHSAGENKFEFNIEDIPSIERKLDAGIEIFERAFNSRPSTFVAPQDQYSREALYCISKKFRIFSTGWVDSSKINAPDMAWYLFNKKIKRSNVLNIGHSKLIEHPGCCFSKFFDVTHGIKRLRDYINKHDIIVIVVHHWEFYEGSELNYELHNGFKNFILEILNKNSYRFINFKELN